MNETDEQKINECLKKLGAEIKRPAPSETALDNLIMSVPLSISELGPLIRAILAIIKERNQLKSKIKKMEKRMAEAGIQPEDKQSTEPK